MPVLPSPSILLSLCLKEAREKGLPQCCLRSLTVCLRKLLSHPFSWLAFTQTSMAQRAEVSSQVLPIEAADLGFMMQYLTTDGIPGDQTVLGLHLDASSGQLCVRGQPPRPGSPSHHLGNEDHSLPGRVSLCPWTPNVSPSGTSRCSTTDALSPGTLPLKKTLF